MHGFSDEERERIEERLVETGRELLRVYGPHKTNVKDITEPVGIAKSSFYLFFDSKAELYVEIVQRESDEFLEDVQRELEGISDPLIALERLFRLYAEFAETNPLIQYREELLNSISPDLLEELGTEQLADYVPIIESIQERSDGGFSEYEPATVLGVMGTIGYLAVHRDEFDAYREGYYEEIQELTITALARGLTASST